MNNDIENLKSRQLARTGFVLIRNALKKDNQALAFDVAEALHNFPENKKNDFQVELTRNSIVDLCKKYPDVNDLKELLLISDPKNTSKIIKKYKVVLCGDIPPSFKEFELLNLEFDFLPAIGDWVTVYFGDDGYFYFKVEGRQYFQQKELREDILHQTSVALYFGKNVFIHSYCTESLGSGLKEGELTSSEKSINRFLKEYGIERSI